MTYDARDEARETTGAVTGDEKEAEDQAQERRHAAREAAPQEQERRHAAREAAPQEQETPQEEQTESEQAEKD